MSEHSEEIAEFVALNKEEQKARDAFEKLRDEQHKVARTAIYTQMPAKMVHLGALIKDLKKPALKDIEAHIHSEVQKMTQEPSSKKRKVEEAPHHEGEKIYHQHFSTNQGIAAKLELLKKELLDVVEVCDVVKVWIQLNIPKIEDGNNFGVSVQEDILGEVVRAEETAYTIMDSIAKFFVTRAQIVTKIIKYPNVSDYAKGLAENDEKQYNAIRFWIVDLRNTYALLYDLLHKNMDKILKPRSHNTATMY